jgi:hypothetical protein
MTLTSSIWRGDSIRAKGPSAHCFFIFSLPTDFYTGLNSRTLPYLSFTNILGLGN